MSQGSRSRGPSRTGAPPPRDEGAAEAQAALDQLRIQAGGALSGREIGDRLGRRDGGDDNAPPLDWRMTPRNILLQIGAVLLFIAVIWFMLSLVFEGVFSIFDFVTGG